MITALREWLTGVVVVTMLLSVAQTLTPEGHLRRIVSFTGGIFARRITGGRLQNGRRS